MEGSVSFEDRVVVVEEEEEEGMVLGFVVVEAEEAEEGFVGGISRSLVILEGCLIDSVGRELYDSLRDSQPALLLVC